MMPCQSPRVQDRSFPERVFRTAVMTSLSLLLLAVPLRAQDEAASSLLGGAYPRINVAAGYALDHDWPHADCREHWGAMSGLTIDAQDRIWTLNRGEVPVQVFDRQGQLLAAWGQGRFTRPHQIRIDPEGAIWIVDAGSHLVQKFTEQGDLLLTLGTAGVAGDDSAHFDGPTDIAITPDGDLFVSDGYGNNRIVHFDATGRFLKTWGRLGSNPGEFSLPHAIALNSRGSLYVADRNNARVQIFDPQGRFLDEWRDLLVPWGLWITDRDEVYACGSSPMRWPGKLPIPGMVLGVPPKDQLVMRFDPEGRLRRLWTFPMPDGEETHPGELDWVHTVAVDSQGDLYLGDIQGQRAQRFTSLDSEAPTAAGGFAGNQPKRDESIRPASNP